MPPEGPQPAGGVPVPLDGAGVPDGGMQAPTSDTSMLPGDGQTDKQQEGV